MKFIDTKLDGAFIVEPERLEDDRGFFARTWAAAEFESRGLDARLAECSVSVNRRKGTLRGMHFQIAPYGEAKLVRCTRGAIYDVIIDLRRESPTFKQWVAVELTGENRSMLYVPEQFAHGFQTLADDTEVFYQNSQVYSPAHGRGVRWNDPAFGIEWPDPGVPRTMTGRDQTYPDFPG